MVDYIGTARLRELISRVGPGRFIEELSGEIDADYRRWDEFREIPRHAIHSSGGVIELMPTSDGRLYSFKYVNGHPKNTAKQLLTVTAFGLLADVATGYPLLLSEMTFVTALRTAATSRTRRPPDGATGEPCDGIDRQRRTERVSSHCLPPHDGRAEPEALRHRSARHLEADEQSRILQLQVSR